MLFLIRETNAILEVINFYSMSEEKGELEKTEL